MTGEGHAPPERTFVSTGQLPPPDEAQALVTEAFDTYRANNDGAVSQVYPALARAAPDQFGICVVGVTANVFTAGDADVQFTMMSVSKPFVFALVCQSIGPEEARRQLGVNSTGLPFNALEAVSDANEGRTNPMVNPGAIAASTLVPGTTAEARTGFIRDGLSRFAGRELSVDDEVYASAAATNMRNRELAALLHSHGRIACDPLEATDVYTRQCCLSVSAHDLAVMGATLANGGVNPITKVRVVDAEVCHYVLAVMATAGLYEDSGDWLYDVGLPGKSGIAGGMITIAPGKGSLGTFAPLLDDAGNSVKGQLVARFLSRRLGLDLFASKAASEGA